MARLRNPPRTPKEEDIKELKWLEEKHRRPTVKDWIRCFVLVILVSASCAASQLSLSPIYGSIPASRYHMSLIVLTPLIPGLIFIALGSVVSPDALERYIPLQAWVAPVLLHYVLAPLSSSLGPTYGPLITEVVVLFPTLLFVSTILMARVDAAISDMQTRTVLGAINIAIFGRAVAQFSEMLLQLHHAAHVLYLGDPLITRWALQTILAVHFTLLRPSRYLVVVIPLVLFQFLVNPHAPFSCTTARLDRTLQHNTGFALLDRLDSTTGYLSVLESKTDAYRVLRCDHSLLGGNWLPTAERRKEGISTPEPIYPVFTMLEAVRMMYDVHEPDLANAKFSDPKSALVVGLGIGTAPRALSLHGIETTVLELDPGVTALAQRWFDFPSNVSVVHTDALEWVKRHTSEHGRYDYVIHDVFTGGAEPLPLFEVSFLVGLRNMLTPDGYAAINYAGDLGDPHTIGVLDTIFTVFDDNCRMYREIEGSRNEIDFTNLVVFCGTGSASAEGVPTWKFRKAEDHDFLNSVSRRHSLPPRYAVDIHFLRVRYPNYREARKKQKDQIKSAEDHWRIMRKVLPAKVWELY